MRRTFSMHVWRRGTNWRWLAVLAMAFGAAQASAEALTANFANSGGAVTANEYSGLVEVTVSGSGNSLFGDLNDAFYLYTGAFAGSPHNDSAGGFYQLEITKGPTLAENQPDDAVNHIVYDVNAGTAVTSPYLPAYRADHTYSFLIDTGSIAGPGSSALRFGVDDGQYGDNSGAYTIEVTAAPTPSAWGGGACVLALLAGARLRGRLGQ